ncbi:hypothetical protein GUITHDRAFT_118167 [Guillardia theta CCMP2712]|uniref:Uncharacterized protein n=1 Tax=Guillardia theta (strain CCMP2712) TaxID=905079 RepID=L1IHE4_GUITC|nr:hypothetical protein GUITHDRAFT_118167 [Guillardia theta CCMP2712]EKX35676.1 hypothetical protein GUITHDRAFT_118167 [Guillardia theta CCMP2712]|eukprot:XP_005822656.1 hypothetical protein GUITHDRAFT_118167 [Guillardia theta CCMP2712]
MQTLFDYRYGDSREYISSVVLLLQNVMDYCSQDATEASAACQQLNVQDFLSKLLVSYGLNVSLSVKNRKTNTFSRKLNIKYCSVPNLRNKTYAAVKELFAAYETSGCSDSKSSRSKESSWKDLSAIKIRRTGPLRVLRHLLDERSLKDSRPAYKQAEQPELDAAMGLWGIWAPPGALCPRKKKGEVSAGVYPYLIGLQPYSSFLAM